LQFFKFLSFLLQLFKFLSYCSCSNFSHFHHSSSNFSHSYCNCTEYSTRRNKMSSQFRCFTPPRTGVCATMAGMSVPVTYRRTGYVFPDMTVHFIFRRVVSPLHVAPLHVATAIAQNCWTSVHVTYTDILSSSFVLTSRQPTCFNFLFYPDFRKIITNSSFPQVMGINFYARSRSSDRRLLP
jgi:hypothetical protein